MNINCDEFNITSSLEVMTVEGSWKKGCTATVGYFSISNEGKEVNSISLGDEIDSPVFIDKNRFTSKINDKIIITQVSISSEFTGFSFCNKYKSQFEYES